eukprot:710610-Pyramimonas_sp.AAC.1
MCIRDSAKSGSQCDAPAPSGPRNRPAHQESSLSGGLSKLPTGELPVTTRRAASTMCDLIARRASGPATGRKPGP